MPAVLLPTVNWERLARHKGYMDVANGKGYMDAANGALSALVPVVVRCISFLTLHVPLDYSGYWRPA